MVKTYFSTTTLGCVVESKVAKEFAEKIYPYDTAEVIYSFVCSVINGDLEINLKTLAEVDDEQA